METTLTIEPSLDKSVTIDPPGWEEKLTVLYSVDYYAGVSYLCWKIQETDHLFRIPATIVYEKHGLKYSDHFLLVLEVFREDYKEWESQNFPEEWMKRYQRIFHHLIK